jgi:hypothetical protein
MKKIITGLFLLNSCLIACKVPSNSELKTEKEVYHKNFRNWDTAFHKTLKFQILILQKSGIKRCGQI